MNSHLLECRLVHHRLSPRDHRFENRLFFAALDLDELPTLDHSLRLFGHRRPSFYRVRETDYLRAESTRLPGASLKTRAAALLQRHGLALHDRDHLTLVTLPRIAGYHFNPVSFYFASGPTGALAAVAEVTNTFRETKTYVLGPATRRGGGSFRLRTPKDFYVSPFSDADTEFDFTLRLSPAGLAVRIDEYHRGRLILHSAIAGQPRPLRDAALAWFAVKYPLLSLQVITRIHTQALRLYLKRLPWRRKTDQPEFQRDYFPARPPSPSALPSLSSSRS